jgi:hypothetical protein
VKLKRIVLLTLILAGSASLWAQTPRRNIEWGFDHSANFADNYKGLGNIFSGVFSKMMWKTAGKMGRGLGFYPNSQNFNTFFNVHLAHFSFGFFAGYENVGLLTMPDHSGNLDSPAALFGEGGVWFSSKIKRFKFTIRPSYYLPLAYMSASSASLDKGTHTFTASIYSPGDLGRLDDASLGNMLSQGGMDLSFCLDYPFLDNLSAGAFIDHIPIVPSYLNHETVVTSGYRNDNGTFDFDTPDTSYVSATRKMITRPVKLGLRARWLPVDGYRIFSLMPQGSVVFNTMYNNAAYCDYGLTAEFNLMNFLIVDAGSYYEDKVFRQGCKFILNFRAVELAFGLSSQSLRFAKSWQLEGLRLDMGLRLGY